MNHDKPEEDETHDGKEADLEDSRIKQITEEVVSPERERETGSSSAFTRLTAQIKSIKTM